MPRQQSPGRGPSNTFVWSYTLGSLFYHNWVRAQSLSTRVPHLTCLCAGRCCSVPWAPQSAAKDWPRRFGFVDKRIHVAVASLHTEGIASCPSLGMVSRNVSIICRGITPASKAVGLEVLSRCEEVPGTGCVVTKEKEFWNVDLEARWGRKSFKSYSSHMKEAQQKFPQICDKPKNLHDIANYKLWNQKKLL